MESNRLVIVLQIFTIITVFKGMSSSYLATEYGIREQLDLVHQYGLLLRAVPIFLLISLVLVALPYFFKEMNPKTVKWMDRAAIAIVILGLLSLLIFF